MVSHMKLIEIGCAFEWGPLRRSQRAAFLHGQGIQIQVLNFHVVVGFTQPEGVQVVVEMGSSLHFQEVVG